MAKGYGKILRVDLKTGKATTEEITEEFARKWVGGRGFGAKILYDEVRGAEPLSEGNKVIIATGPLAGTLCPQGAKTSFHTKSPLTGGYADSNMGGMFAPEMRYAGYDVIILENRAEKPSILVIDDDKVELRDAKEHWGKGAIDTELALKKELGEEFQCAVIGPAGENLVKFACITHDFGRQAGRTGIGAVLGHKRIKAVCVRGTKDAPVADIRAMERIAKRMHRTSRSHKDFKMWQDYGTSFFIPLSSEWGSLPTRNFQTGTYEHADKIDHKTMRERIVKLDKACFGCPMCCGKYSYSSRYKVYCEGCEYETMAMLGANCGLTDVEDVLYANWLCDNLGMDTISAGSVCAFIMEAGEKGLIQAAPKFGDAQGLFELLQKIARREGIGNVAAEGTKQLAAAYGGREFAMQVKGMEMSAYESRGAPAMLLSYMTCDVGAHHNRSWAVLKDLELGRDKIEGKADVVIDLQHKRPLFDILGCCRFCWIETGVPLEDYAEIFNAVTGFGFTVDDLLRVSERVWNLTRCYWWREVEGFGRSWDMPPEREMKEPVPSGTAKGLVVPPEKVNALLDDYYRKRGWDENGKPTKEKLTELGLDFAINDIYG